MVGADSKVRTLVVWAAAVCAAAVCAAAALAGPASAHIAPDTVVEQAFAADSGDTCQYGYVRGVLGWRVGPGIPEDPRPVAVRGGVLDRPLSTSRNIVCGDDDRRLTTATLTAYTRGVVVDEQAVRVDNDITSFTFQLENEAAGPPIDTVVVQVCRSPVGQAPGYCGQPQKYHACRQRRGCRCRGGCRRGIQDSGAVG